MATTALSGEDHKIFELLGEGRLLIAIILLASVGHIFYCIFLLYIILYIFCINKNSIVS